jgi:predicted 3-demethylubiquinone-9 3-methyltransferase (glyoxalase superfamily)
MSISTITPCLWFNGQAEEAANHYTSIFKNSSIQHVQRYTDAGKATHGHDAGQVMVVAFTLNGQSFVGLNGGPQFKFSEAISFQVDCADQAEVDHYWSRLGEGGDESKQHCGWLADRYGVSWQIVPRAMKELLSGSDPEGAKRVTEAMLKMKKIDVEGLRKAYDG